MCWCKEAGARRKRQYFFNLSGSSVSRKNKLKHAWNLKKCPKLAIYRKGTGGGGELIHGLFYYFRNEFLSPDS
jgi:hypothetical protein